METTTITMIAILVVIALLLVWLSLSMAATEGAVGRVTRASLNNLILEIRNSYATRRSNASTRCSG